MDTQEATGALLRDLVAQHGELLTGERLRTLLGYQSGRSFLRASKEGRLPISVFRLPGRRGVFARTRDLAAWLSGLVPNG